MYLFRLFVCFISLLASQISLSFYDEATEGITGHFQPAFLAACGGSLVPVCAVAFVIHCQVVPKHNNEKAREAVEPQSQN